MGFACRLTRATAYHFATLAVYASLRRAGLTKAFPMWTLIIIVLINGNGPSSGAGSSMSSLIFASQDQCKAAATQIGGSGYVGVDNGPYRIVAKCIERATNGGALVNAKH
jgi:hypothetical protein